MDLHPRFNKKNGDLSKHVHSNGYARSAYGPRIGSTTPQAFTQRISVERNRQVVGHYRNSQIGSLTSHTTGPEDVSKHGKPSQEGSRDVPTRGSRPNLAPKPQSFREPPGRTFNPYS